MNKLFKERYKYTDVASILAEAGELPVADAVISLGIESLLYDSHPASLDIPEVLTTEPVFAANLQNNAPQGVQVSVPQGYTANEFMEIHVNYPESKNSAYTVRNTIKMGTKSSGRFVLYHSPAKAGSVINSVILIEADVDSNIEFIEIATSRAAVLSTILVSQAANSRVHVVTADLDNRSLVRNQFVILSGEGSQCSLNGIYITGKGQLADNYTNMEHKVGNCASNQLFKSIAGDRSTAVFTGHIVIAQDAQQSIAYQQNHNIALGEGAWIITKPWLEIYADDVKCSHGATIGKLDPEALYYMRQRGIPLEEAKKLQLEGFAEDALALEGFEKLDLDIRTKITHKLKEL